MKKAAAATETAQDRKIRARNKAQILKAAIRIFSRKGFDGTRIAEIAEIAGLPKANVYYYFPTKEAIYKAVIDSLLEDWNRAFDHIAAERDPAEAIAGYVRAKLAFSRSHAAESKMFANENVRGGDFLSRRQKASIRDITNQKAAVIEAWIKQGKIDPIDPRHFFIILWSSTQFYADFDSVACNSFEVSRLSSAQFDKAAETIIQIVLKGIGLR